ncbi:MAG: hypothetical protein HUK22_08245, partial [Thermoguttaceae bacterium]|nr:hypothetical protein [Thermoguttaceae bacterium]
WGYGNYRGSKAALTSGVVSRPVSNAAVDVAFAELFAEDEEDFFNF